MASKKLVIRCGAGAGSGAIAYLSYNKAPAGKDAAGTIVEAKRARADGTNSFNPTPTASTTEQNAADVAKGTAVADAANAADAAAAAGSADNGLNGGGSHLSAKKATDSADAAAAAKGGASKSHMDAAKAADSAAAARGQDNSRLRGGSAAGHD